MIARVLGALLVIAGLAAGSMQAAPVAGQDDPAYAEAVDAWLAGDEERGLRGLAGLAGRGNAAARILLALIDTTPAYQGPWLAGQSRADRIAVMRAPGGLSGQNWMLAAAATEPLAQAWLRLWDTQAPAEVVLDFARMGEGRAARMAARQLFMRERRGFGAISADPDYPADLIALAVLDLQTEDPARAGLAPGDPQRELLEGVLPDAALLQTWADQAPLGAELVAAVRGVCPQGDLVPGDLAAYLAQSGGFLAAAWFGPPSETLIDPQAYRSSPQAAQTARNLLKSDPFADGALLAASPCVASALAARKAADTP